MPDPPRPACKMRLRAVEQAGPGAEREHSGLCPRHRLAGAVWYGLRRGGREHSGLCLPAV